MKAVLAAAYFALSCFLCVSSSSADEVEERKAIEASARLAFIEGRFEELEETAKEFRTSRQTTASGDSKLAVFYEALDTARELYGVADEAAFEKTETQLRSWSDPGSRLTRSRNRQAFCARPR